MASEYPEKIDYVTEQRSCVGRMILFRGFDKKLVGISPGPFLAHLALNS